MRRTSPVLLLALALFLAFAVNGSVVTVNTEDAPLADRFPKEDVESVAQSVPKTNSKYVINNFTVYPVPRVPPPKKGVPFQDPHFNTTIVRVTDREIDGYHVGYKGPGGMENVYCRFDCDNADGSYILLYRVKGVGFHLYDGGTFKYLKPLPTLKPGSEPRWDWANPRILYFLDVEGIKLCKLNVATEKSEVVYDFGKHVPSAKRIRTGAEGDSSVDGMKWALRAEDPEHAWLWYDRLTGVVNVKRNTPDTDHVSTSSLGGFFTTGGRRMPNKVDGIFSLTPDFSIQKKLNRTVAHADVAVDADGNEVIVFHAYRDKKPWIVMCDLKTGMETKLIRNDGINWRCHFAGNCIATPGWVLVSTYGTGPYEVTNWRHQSLYMLELKQNPRVWRIAHTHGAWDDTKGEGGGRDYWAEAFATINTEGTRVYWGSTWDQPYGTRTIESYVAELPLTWYKDLMGAEGARAARTKVRTAIGRSLGATAAKHYDRLTSEWEPK